MHPEKRVFAYLWDMLQAANEVVDMVADVSIEEFRENLVLMRAVERSLEIIGEAGKRVFPDYVAAHPEVPWKEIIGQRNILAHEYGQIDHDMLFRTVIEDLPDLISQLQDLLPPIEE